MCRRWPRVSLGRSEAQCVAMQQRKEGGSTGMEGGEIVPLASRHQHPPTTESFPLCVWLHLLACRVPFPVQGWLVIASLLCVLGSATLIYPPRSITKVRAWWSLEITVEPQEKSIISTSRALNPGLQSEFDGTEPGNGQ